MDNADGTGTRPVVNNGARNTAVSASIQEIGRPTVNINTAPRQSG
jgi:hypothetical protein